MTKKKNQARLEYKGQNFVLWQDEKDNWCYQLDKLESVSTQQKELQPALNQAYEAIREQSEILPHRLFVPKKAVYEGNRK